MASIFETTLGNLPQRAPSPACGGGLGWGLLPNCGLAGFPLPVPPPQAGEGTQEPRRLGYEAALHGTGLSKRIFHAQHVPHQHP
jgi:hypothetical protein